MTPPIDQRTGIVAVDGTAAGEALTKFVDTTFHPSWQWIVVHVIDLTAAAHPTASDRLKTNASTVVDTAARHLPGATTIVESSTDVADGLRTVAREHHASLLVVGAGNQGRVATVLLGSVSKALIHESPCPIVTFSERAD